MLLYICTLFGNIEQNSANVQETHATAVIIWGQLFEINDVVS